MKKEELTKTIHIKFWIKNIVLLLLFFVTIYSCSKQKKITNNSYKGYGVFFYHKIRSGSIYEVKFIPFHLDETNEISLKVIEKESKNLIFERGISFNSFRDGDVLDQVFIDSKSCGDIRYCFAYVDFKENEQETIDKWYKKRGYTDTICIGNEKYRVVYDPTEIDAKNLIKIKTLNIIK